MLEPERKGVDLLEKVCTGDSRQEMMEGMDLEEREKNVFVICVSASLPDNAQHEVDGDSLKCLAFSVFPSLYGEQFEAQ